jgi:hypothetical protein
MRTIGFDALTTCVTGHRLEAEGMPEGMIAALMLKAAETKFQAGAHSYRVMIKGWAARGDAIIPGGDPGALNIEVVMPQRGDLSESRFIGVLKREGRRLRFVTQEIMLGTGIAARQNGGLLLQVRQHMPDSLRLGMTGLVGQPLSMLVAHPALQRAQGGMVRIAAVHAPLRAGSRLRRPQSGDEGVDVELDAPEVEIREDMNRRMGLNA